MRARDKAVVAVCTAAARVYDGTCARAVGWERKWGRNDGMSDTKARVRTKAGAQYDYK